MPLPIVGEGINWAKVDPALRHFVCSADSHPAWCQAAKTAAAATPVRRSDEPRRITSWDELRPKRPGKNVSDDAYRQAVERLREHAAQPGDFGLIERRGFEDMDGTAFEILGYLYANGLERPTDYTRAYEYYGLALMVGRRDAAKNVTELWEFIDLDDKKKLVQRFEEAFPKGPINRPPPPPSDDEFEDEDES